MMYSKLAMQTLVLEKRSLQGKEWKWRNGTRIWRLEGTLELAWVWKEQSGLLILTSVTRITEEGTKGNQRAPESL